MNLGNTHVDCGTGRICCHGDGADGAHGHKGGGADGMGERYSVMLLEQVPMRAVARLVRIELRLFTT